MSPVTRSRATPVAVRDTPAYRPVDDAPVTRPRAGEVLLISEAASVQFLIPMRFRVIRVHDWPTYTGWLWLDGYQLDTVGDAVERRSIFVQAHGLRRVAVPAPRPRHAGERRRGPPN